MEFSTWLSSASLDLKNGNNNNNNTLCLFNEAPVRDVKHVKPIVDVRVSPSSSNEGSSKLFLKDKTGALVEELNRVNAENKRLTEMLTVVCENYNDLKRQLVDYMSKSCSNEINNNVNKKRKVENNSSKGNNSNGIVAVRSNNNGDSSSSDEEDSYEKPKEETIKAKITRVAVRTEASDSSLILKDGYQYGQKVTRDNPCPRAYFKCSFAPSCPVKKKVQRSLEDQSMLVATYEGEHNHPPPAQQEGGAAPSSSNRPLSLGSAPCNGPAPTVTLDLTKSKSNVSSNNVNDLTTTSNTTTTNNNNNNNNKMLNNTSNQLAKFNSPEFQKLLAEQMASSLTKDPNFTAALAAAITGRFIQQSSSD